MKIKPSKLNNNDVIGIISPSGDVRDRENFDRAVKYFKSKGFRVKTGPHAYDRKDYLAGNDVDRLKDLESFFIDDEIKMILCSRGGYGTFRLLDSINYSIISNNPKIFVGYSDITAFLSNFYHKSGLITFHGPLCVSDFGKEKPDEYTEEMFWKIVTNSLKIPFDIPNPYDYQCIIPGSAEGELICGNLAILCGLLGTGYAPDFTDKILVIEDVGEPLYKIDRMLMQLKLAGVFEKISGILFAEFSSIPDFDENNAGKIKLTEMISELIADTGLPSGYGFPAGHGEQKATLPLGVKYFFDSDNFKLQIKEEYLTTTTPEK